jgi:glutathione synthase/RimK-type ligase-like ATP-grasp enzyme
MILILAQTDDPTAYFVVEKLRQRGAELYWCDRTQFPTQSQLSLSYPGLNGSGRKFTLRQDGQLLNLDRFAAVWYRPHRVPTFHKTPMQNFINQQAITFADQCWHSLDCLWVPGPRLIVRRAEYKTWQMDIAQELGFEIPPTLISNSPEEFLDFYRRHHGQIVSKTIHNGAVWASNDENSVASVEAVASTAVVTPRDTGYASTVRYCPIIFQAYVPKQVELRITVVGRELFACEIHSQQTYHTRYDWRRYDKNTPHCPHQLPDEMHRLCLALVERLGLFYGAIDLILTPDGRYVFLEINANGEFAWIEGMTGLPISDALCNLLMSV